MYSESGLVKAGYIELAENPSRAADGKRLEFGELIEFIEFLELKNGVTHKIRQTRWLLLSRLSRSRLPLSRRTYRSFCSQYWCSRRCLSEWNH